MSAMSPEDYEDMMFGAAWRGAQRALPGGWHLWGVWTNVYDDGEPCGASAIDPNGDDVDAYGPTHTAALNALTNTLNARHR